MKTKFKMPEVGDHIGLKRNIHVFECECLITKLEDEEYFIRNAQPREVYYEATRYLNVLGGTYILDYFSSEEICEKVVNYMENLSDATYKIKVASM